MGHREAAADIVAALEARNRAAHDRFRNAAPFIAETGLEMAERFTRGGRILALGYGAWASDAGQVTLEFAHPIIAAGQPLPAIDVSALGADEIATLLGADDMVMAFGTDGAEVVSIAEEGARSGAMIIAPLSAATDECHPFVKQEWCETLCHALRESVHIFQERWSGGSSVQDIGAVLDQVAESILAAIADESDLRTAVAATQSEAIAGAIALTRRKVIEGGTILTLGSGRSAASANDFAFDCAAPPPGIRPLAALSFASGAATIVAAADDAERDQILVRQLLARGQPTDIVYAFSTNGSSPETAAALVHARGAGMATVALLGHGGGDVARLGLADVAIVVPSDRVSRVQDVQASIYHIMREAFDARREY